MYLVRVAVVVDKVISFLGHSPVEEAIVVPRSLLTHNLQGGLVVPWKEILFLSHTLDL